MIVTLLNPKGGISKATLALHFAGAKGREGKRDPVAGTDPQGRVCDRSRQHARIGTPWLLRAIGLGRQRATLHWEAREGDCGVERVVIGPAPIAASLPHSASLTAGLTRLSSQPSPFHGRACRAIPRSFERASILAQTRAAGAFPDSNGGAAQWLS